LKKLRMIVIVFFACAALVVVVALTADLRNGSGNTGSNQGLDVYYVNPDTLELVSEKENVDGTSADIMLNNAVKAMKNKPNDEQLKSAIPDSVTVLSISCNNQVAHIDFSSGYYSLNKPDEMCLRGAVVWTLTGLYFVKKVDISVEGAPLLKTSGEVYGDADRENTLISPSIVSNPVTSVKIVYLYFPNSDATDLSKEERKIEVNKNQPLEKYVMEELIKGPQDKSNIAAIPNDTKIRSINTSDGICYVDLSSEFVTKRNGTEAEDKAMIYSIVDSLTKLGNIDKVQFLIEGEKQNDYRGHIDFGKPFEAKDISQ